MRKLLTPREYSVLGLLALGFTNADIARQLRISSGTVRNMVAHIIKKLQVADRTQAALLAYQAGLGNVSQLPLPTTSGDAANEANQDDQPIMYTWST